MHVIQYFTQLQTLKSVSLAEAQKDDRIRMREEAFVEEIRKQEREWERMRLSVRAKRATKLAETLWTSLFAPMSDIFGAVLERTLMEWSLFALN